MFTDFSTSPHEQLHPKKCPDEVQKLLNYFSKGLADGVNFGSQILSWEIENGKGGVENIPIWMLFRHFLELIDAVSILVQKSSIDPCIPILRSALETSLQLEYLLETDYENRAKSFIVCNYYEKIQFLNKLKPNTKENKEFISDLSKDKNNPLKYKEFDYSGIDKEIESIKSILNHIEYKKVVQEYERINKKSIKWYHLFNGPKNIEQLSIKLKRNALYEIFYRHWSGVTHGTDILNHMAINKEDNIEIMQLRLPQDAQKVCLDASTLLFHTFETIQSKRATIERMKFKDWFINYRKFFNQLNGPSLINVKN